MLIGQDKIPELFTQELGFTFNEFLRKLPAAVGNATFSVEGREVRISYERGSITILFQETIGRRLGSLVLPATPVTFQFSGLDSTQRKTFMTRFGRVYQKGGG